MIAQEKQQKKGKGNGNLFKKSRKRGKITSLG